MKTFRKILAALIILLQIISLPMVHAQVTGGAQIQGGAGPSTTTTTRPPADENATFENTVKTKAEEIADKTIFNNFAALAGPTCGLYGLGVDIVNFFYSGSWSPVESLLEVSALFKNNSWRELIWALDDQKEVFVKQMTELRKQQCVLGFSLPESDIKDPKRSQQSRSQISQLDRKINQLQAKIDYFGIQGKNMFLTHPKFDDPTTIDATKFPIPDIQTDKIFYTLASLGNLFEIDWDEFTRDAKQSFKTQDWGVALDAIPDGCFAAINMGHELALYFAYAYTYSIGDGKYKDKEGNEFTSYKDFIERNNAKIAQSYLGVCSKAEPKPSEKPDEKETDVEKQLADFQKIIKGIIDRVTKQLKDLNKGLKAFDDKVAKGTPLTEKEVQSLRDLEYWAGTDQATIDFYTLVLSKVGSSAAKSLSDLTKHLNDFVEAIIGVTRDKDDKASSRLSFSERFQNQKEKNLQSICARIEAMYRASGRDTGDLPVIGTANGYTYCRTEFDGSQPEPSQPPKDVFKEIGEDIGYLLEQRSYGDLLNAQKLHYVSKRAKYKALYTSQGDTTVVLENMLRDVSKNLYNKEVPAVFDPNKPLDKTHYSLLRKIYQDLWKFMKEQEGSCNAPENPEA